jgi:trans-aconitate methyltransferase
MGQWNSEKYDAQHSFVWRYGADVLRLLDPASGECILDLGCGTGHLTAQIAEKGARVVGVDSSAEMIATARANYPDLEFQAADAASLAFHSEFDAVFSNAVLHWVKDHDGVAFGVANALKHKGRFVAEFGGRGNIEVLLLGLREALRESASLEDFQPWFFPSISEYASLLERHGFNVSFAQLFARPTELQNGECGLREWLDTFVAPLLVLSKEQWQAVCERTETLLRPLLFANGKWRLDYVRLRICAEKP